MAYQEKGIIIPTVDLVVALLKKEAQLDQLQTDFLPGCPKLGRKIEHVRRMRRLCGLKDDMLGLVEIAAKRPHLVAPEDYDDFEGRSLSEQQLILDVSSRLYGPTNVGEVVYFEDYRRKI